MDEQTPLPAQQRTDLDMAYFHKRLLEERDLAQAAIDGTRAAEQDGTGEMGMEKNELSQYDENDPADAATDLQIHEQDLALIANAQVILSQIHRALEKFAEGTYGLSDRSHQPIAKERLEYLPYATLTMEEAAIEEAG